MGLDEILTDDRVKRNISILKHNFNFLDRDDLDSCAHRAMWIASVNFKPDKAHVSTYVYRIFKNYLIKLAKKEKHDNLVYLDEIDHYNPLFNVDMKDLLNSLNKAEEQLLRDRFFDNMTLKEMSIKYNMKISTVRRRILSVLEKCKVLIGE